MNEGPQQVRDAISLPHDPAPGETEGGGLDAFVPPTPQQFQQLLDAHPLRPPSKLLLWLPIIGLGAVLLLALTAEHVWSLLGMIAAVAVVIIAVQYRVRQVRQLEIQTARVQELAMLRRDREALRLAWRTLPRCVSLPDLYHRQVAAMAQSLDALRCHEAAIIGYSRLLDHVPAEHPGALHVRMLKAIAELSSDQLADADDELRRLYQWGVDREPERDASNDERSEDTGESSSAKASRQNAAALAVTRAGYHLACLLQQVRTYHYADAVAGLDNLQQRLRPLGVDAGHGYGLAALACQQQSQRLADKQREASAADQDSQEAGSTSDPDLLMKQAGQWWSRATLLLSLERLTGRFTELSKVAEDPALARWAGSADPPEQS